MKITPITTITQKFKKSVLRFFKRSVVDNESNKLYNKIGIDHDLDYIAKCVRNSDKNFHNNIDNLNWDLLRGRDVRTAVYLAAGIDSTENLINRYSSIKGINNLILIDYRIEKYECIIINDSFRIFSVPCEVVKSAAIIEKCYITIDILFELNCGINLGHGFFSLSSNQVLSLFEPYCNKNQFVFVGSYDYQKCNEQYKIARDYLSCFQYNSKKRITAEDLNEMGYLIELSNFTNYSWSSKAADITVFNNKKEESEIIIEKGDIKLHFIQGNIFSLKNELDILFLYFRNLFMYRQYNNAIINALDIRGKYQKRLSENKSDSTLVASEDYIFMNFNDLIQFANKYNAKKIGFIPLKSFDYVSYINSICTEKSEITDLYFFYFDKKDLDSIYKLKEIATI